jgi:DNA-binding winged helix-turn-helix (wHTH) protein/Tol biopolymer transport system component
MPGHNSSVFRFGDVEVHEGELHIRRNGDAVPVEPKAFRILLHLLRNPGRLVPKEELIAAGWGDTAVTDNSLTRNIALLRRLLGDDSREPRFIETVSTVGYRFVSPVEVVEGTAGIVESSGNATAKTQKTSRRRTILIWLPLCAAFVILAAVSAWYMLQPLPPPIVSSFRQITFDGGDKDIAGTDGTRIYFNRDQKMRRSVSVVLASGGDTAEIPIHLPHDVWVEDVSPDGANFLVVTGENGASIARPQWIVRATDGVPVRRLPDAAGYAAFSTDGKSVVYCTRDGDIWRVGSDGTGAVRIGLAGGACTGLEWSPDGSRIRFYKNGRLWEISTNGSNLHPVLPDGADPGSQSIGLWTTDGSFYVFPGWSLGSPGALRGDIWALDERRGWLRRPSRVPVRLTAAPTDWQTSYPAKEGNTVFATGGIPRGELSRFDGKTHQFQPFLGGISAQGVTFSRDGRSVAYVSYPEGYLFKSNSDGSNPVQITDGKIGVYEPAWSPDGTQIAFMSFPGEHIELYVVSANGGVPHRALPDDPDNEWNAAWSPDGKEIAFCILPPTVADMSKSRIRIVNISTRQVRDLPGSMSLNGPLWSPDGRFMIANTANFSNLMLFETKTQKWIPLLEKMSIGFPTWSSDSQWLYYWSKDSAGNAGIYRIRIPSGKPELVVSLKGVHTGGWWNSWIGLDAADAPLIMRDIGSHEIYALTLDRR